MKLHTLTRAVCYGASFWILCAVLFLRSCFHHHQEQAESEHMQTEPFHPVYSEESLRRGEAEFPGERGSSFSCSADPIIHLLHITYANVCICVDEKELYMWPLCCLMYNFTEITTPTQRSTVRGSLQALIQLDESAAQKSLSETFHSSDYKKKVLFSF